MNNREAYEQVKEIFFKDLREWQKPGVAYEYDICGDIDGSIVVTFKEVKKDEWAITRNKSNIR